MVRMMAIIQYLTFPGGLVVVYCAGTFSVDNACTLLPKHKRYAGIDMISKCLASRLFQLALIFICHILNGQLDTNGVDN